MKQFLVILNLIWNSELEGGVSIWMRRLFMRSNTSLFDCKIRKDMEIC